MQLAAINSSDFGEIIISISNEAGYRVNFNKYTKDNLMANFYMSL